MKNCLKTTLVVTRTGYNQWTTEINGKGFESFDVEILLTPRMESIGQSFFGGVAADDLDWSWDWDAGDCVPKIDKFGRPDAVGEIFMGRVIVPWLAAQGGIRHLADSLATEAGTTLAAIKAAMVEDRARARLEFMAAEAAKGCKLQAWELERAVGAQLAAELTAAAVVAQEQADKQTKKEQQNANLAEQRTIQQAEKEKLVAEQEAKAREEAKAEAAEQAREAAAEKAKAEAEAKVKARAEATAKAEAEAEAAKQAEIEAELMAAFNF